MYFGVIIYNRINVLCDGIKKPEHKTDISDPNHVNPPTPTPLRTDRHTHAVHQQGSKKRIHFPGYDAMYSGRFSTFGTNIDRGSMFPKHIN